MPFVVDVCQETMIRLDQILQQSCDGATGNSDWPPSQLQECMIVSSLNLLRLQVVESCRISVTWWLVKCITCFEMFMLSLGSALPIAIFQLFELLFYS